jgi:hypothetical protein
MTELRPDFVIIGAMKSATTTLHEQLSRQSGFWMSRPKEPNFFSDDEIYQRGWNWYGALFRGAPEGWLRGESSTHYSKLPTYKRSVERMHRDLPGLKLIYLMRHPVDRLISQYVHERTVGRITTGIRDAVLANPELIAYSRYAYQIAPFLDAYGRKNVLPVFFGRLVSHPQAELERIGRFLGHSGGELRWDETMEPQNRGSERLRPSVTREVLVRAPVLTTIRQRLMPKRISRAFRAFWRAGERPPDLPADCERRLHDIFDEDLEQLGQWLGTRLDCARFHDVTTSRPLDWSDELLISRRALGASGPTPSAGRRSARSANGK